MDRRLDAGALLVAASAGLLVVALFLHWFGHDGTAITAWQAFEVLDLVLLAAAVAAVLAAFGRLPARVLLGAAGVVALVVVSQLIQPPPAGQFGERQVGAWLALAASVGLVAGAALAAAHIAISLDVSGRERRPRVAAVDRRDPDAGVTGTTSEAHEPRSDAEADDTPARTEEGGGRVQQPDAAGGDPFARPPGGSVSLDPAATQAFQLPPEPKAPEDE
jgi:hypothetical protein